MDFEKNCNLIIHSRLEITTPDGNFEGLLKFVSITGQRATFEHVFELPSREYLGTMHILFSSILSWKVHELPEGSFDVVNFDSSQEVFNGEFGKNERIDKVDLVKMAPGSHFVEYLPPYLKNNCPCDYCIIDCISPVFQRALKHLSESSIIGVSFHGPKISRNGILTWLSISTSTCVFLFDIQKLGEAAFEKGLKDLFEDKKIVKVIHDCREAADCLCHMFTTELKTVFDTQVADYLINMQMYIGKKSFKYVNSLDSCLFKYLKVPQQFLYNHNNPLSFDEKVKFYQKRPPSGDFFNTLIKSSMYLPLLKDEQEKMLMSPYEQATKLYLNSLQSATDSEVHMIPTESSNITPTCLLESVKYVRFFDVPQPPDEFIKLFKETLREQDS